MAHWQVMPGVSGDLSDFTSELFGGGDDGGGLTVPDPWKDPTAGSAAAHPSPMMATASSATMEVPDATPTVPSWPSATDARVLCEAVWADWEDAAVPSWSTTHAEVAGTAWAPAGSMFDGGGSMNKGARGTDATATPPWSDAEHLWGPTPTPWHCIDGISSSLWGFPSAAADGGVDKVAGVGTPSPTTEWAPGVDARGFCMPSAPAHVAAADVDLPTVPEEDVGAAASAATTAVSGRAHAAPVVVHYGDSVVDAVVAAAAADAAAAAGTAAAAATRGVAVAATLKVASGAAIASVVVERMAAGAPTATATYMAAATPITAATPPTLSSPLVKPWESQLYPTGVPLQLARRAVAAVAAAGLARPYRPPPRHVAPRSPWGGPAAAYAAAPPALPSPRQQLTLPPPPSRSAQTVGFLLPPPRTAGDGSWPVASTEMAPRAPPSVPAATFPSAAALPVARRRVAKARSLRSGRFVRLT